ncbi:IscS subfamily cysteine desulfurase [Cytobacillus suaedae]|nr:IscS subfamily cysteine desulfurase [Cytobacillus suaedae]
MIYLDYAATTPMRDESIQAYSEVAKKIFGNPSSLHDHGTSAKNVLEGCREELAKLVAVPKNGIFFTGGGTDANILAIQSLLLGNTHRGKHLITTKVEHSSVKNLFKKLEDEGYTVTYLNVTSSGEVNLKELEESITDNTVLASIHHVNSEIGVIQPIHEIGKILKKHDILFHSDCVQSFGKIPINIKEANLDSISISSHKIYGPKGVGAAYINPMVKWCSVFPNTTHEFGFRPGTVDVPGIAAFVIAAQLIYNEMTDEHQRLQSLRTHLINEISQLNLPIEIINQAPIHIPTIAGLLIKGIEGQYSMLECNRHGMAISTGSACQVGQQEPSKTMIAIGKTPDIAKQFIRISFGKNTTMEDINYLLKIMKQTINNFNL